MTPNQISPEQWQHARDVARQTCARFFRDGGTPADAMEAFGVAHPDAVADWKQAVEMIARALCAHPVRQAA